MPIQSVFNDDDRKDLEKHEQATKVTFGLFCKLKCQRKECGKEFRLLDYRGFIFDGTLTCPACLYVQFGGFQQLTRPIECLRCHYYSPKIKFYCNSKSSGSIMECRCPRPSCQVLQEDALKIFYQEQKNSRMYVVSKSRSWTLATGK